MKKKILFIEDDNILQKALFEMLEKENVEFLSAFDGRSGLEMAKKEKPDLILLDLILPKLDGFSVLEELKKDENTKNIPVVVITNLEDLESLQKAMDHGVKSYLVKSEYTLEEICQKIKQILQ